MTDNRPDELSLEACEMRAFTDDLRPRHPVIRTHEGEWLLLDHAAVVGAAMDDTRFSSAVSRHLQIPNGLDGTAHDLFRAIVDRHLTTEAIAPFLPVFEAIADRLIAGLPRGKPVDAVREIGAVFAVRAQCAWLGWPESLEARLLDWMETNHAATRSGQTERTAEVAAAFDDIIRSVLLPRLSADLADQDDVTARLCRETVQGRPLNLAELTSILRNWTGGDLGSMALCVGVIVAHLCREPELTARLVGATDDELDATIDEILRLDDPFLSNRRITTCPVRIGGADLPAGARVRLVWTSANRDERVFGPGGFDPARHAAANLVYGIGRHACPGRALATAQLRIAVRALLSQVRRIGFVAEDRPEREVFPLGGYRRVPVVLD